MKRIQRRLKEVIQLSVKNWNTFWFESHRPQQMAVLRIALGILLFLFYSIRALDLNWFFSQNGVLTLDVIADTMPMRYRFSILQVFTSDASLLILHTVFLGSLLTMAMGWWPRISAAIAFLLHVSFMHRNMTIVFGADLIATFFLMYLAIARTDGKALASDSWASMLSSVALRFAQIQVCIIYAYSGWEKLKGVAWWKGEAIWTVVANAQLARWDFGWVSHFPLFVMIATYLTLLWEIYFVALVWVPKWRAVMLIFGVLMHVGIGVVVNIPYFAMLMVVTYAVFLKDSEAAYLLRCVNFLRPLRLQAPSGVKISSQV